MNSARKLPRLNSDPSGYDKEAQYENFNKGHNKFRSSFRRSNSPEREAGDRGRDMYGKYNNHRQDRDYKYGSRKDIRDSERDRDRSPRDRKSWDYKEKSREKDGVDGRGAMSSCNDWTEHKSSNGKKYYYNSKTEVSQWEKPREWVEAEKSRQAQMDKSRDWCDQDKVRAAPAKLHCDRNSRSSQDKHSLDGHRSSPLSSSSSSSLAGQGGGGSGLLGRHRDRRCERGGGSSTPSHSYQGHTPTSLHNHNSSTTPNNHHDSQNHTNHLNFHRENSHRISESSVGESGGGEDKGDATPTSEGEGEHHPAPGDQVMHPGGAVSLSAAIPRITSQPQLGLSVSTQPGPGPGSMNSRLPPGHPHSYSLPHPSPLSLYGHSSSPPTPTHDSLPSPSVVSPLSSRLPQSSLGQLGSVGQLHPPIQLTPSLSRLYKEPLIGHVLGWPAEQVERGCNKISEEAHQISSHGITKVSADLKMARSLVRLAEIQATLQEQRILFLRQQMSDLERVDRPNSREKSRDRESLASRDLVLRDTLAPRESRDLLAARELVTRDSNALSSSSMSRDQSLPREVPGLTQISRDRENNLPRDQSHLAESRDRLPSAESLQSQNVGNTAYSSR